MAASKAREIVVEIRNEPGAGALVFSKLGGAKINISALIGYAEGKKAKKKAWIHLVPDDYEAACKILKEAGYKFETGDVVMVELPNRPGAIADAAEKLAANHINIEYAYASGATKTKALVAFKVPNAAKAIRALG